MRKKSTVKKTQEKINENSNNDKEIKYKNSKKNKKTENKESIFNKLGAYYKKNYKLLMIFPLLLFIFSSFMVFKAIQDDGTPIYRDISLKGGLSAIINIESDKETETIRTNLMENFPENEFSVSQLTENGIKSGYIIDTDLEEEKLKSFLNTYFNTEFNFGDNYSSNYISPTLSNAFFKQAMTILVISLVLMSLVIFLYFRQIVPSSAVVLSAIFDIIVTVGILNFMEFKISIAGIGALLMLIGYSIDTDVLLTNRVYREKGENYFEKTFFAFRTGILMSGTTLTAGIAAIILTNSEVIQEIALIMVIGLLVDFVSTWFQNSGILLWWLEKKDSK